MTANEVLILTALAFIIYLFFTRNERRDRKRWPYIMKNEDSLRDPKHGANRKSKKIANDYRDMRKKQEPINV